MRTRIPRRKTTTRRSVPVVDRRRSRAVPYLDEALFPGDLSISGVESPDAVDRVRVQTCGEADPKEILGPHDRGCGVRRMRRCVS